MTANEQFNYMLNSCEHPRAVFDALRALIPVFQAVKQEDRREALLEAVKLGVTKEGGAQE